MSNTRKSKSTVLYLLLAHESRVPLSRHPLTPHHATPHYTCQSTNYDVFIVWEVVGWDGEIKWCWSLANAARDIVMGTVAWAEPSSEIACLSDGHTTEMRAHSQHDQPLRFLHAVRIRLRISQGLPVRFLRRLDFVVGPVSDEHGLASPFDDNLWRSVSAAKHLMGVMNVRSCLPGWWRVRLRPWPAPRHLLKQTY